MTATEPHLVVLHVADCPNLAPLLERLRDITDLPVSTREVTTDEAATRYGMNGSPTLLIDGIDPFATPSGNTSGLACRIYRDESRAIVPIPSAMQLRDALGGHKPPSCETAAGDTLSAWRAATRPLDPLHQEVHQAILRSYATRGRPPTTDELDTVTSETNQNAHEVLIALHERDAIRLDATGAVSVAYPFSTTPTHHRVLLANGVEVYAMCAIDALGISALLDMDTEINSADPTTGALITISTTGSHTRWNPTSAVAFITATAGNGPSADCCCDHLNVFTNTTTAAAWTTAHPHIPGQILAPTDAEALARRLFPPLTTTP